MTEIQEEKRRERLGRVGKGSATIAPVNPARKRLIKTLRLVLPLGAFALIFLLFALQSEDELIITPPREQVQPEGQLEMAGARYEGLDGKSQPYTVTATTARRDLETPDLLDMKHPMADILLENGHWIAARADFGQYAEESGALSLQGIVKIFHDTGYEMTTAAVDIDLNGGSAQTDTPVTLQGPAALLEATGMKIENNGMNIIFNGPAKLKIYEKNL